jgi:hypothetical protein
MKATPSNSPVCGKNLCRRDGVKDDTEGGTPCRPILRCCPERRSLTAKYVCLAGDQSNNRVNLLGLSESELGSCTTAVLG